MVCYVVRVPVGEVWRSSFVEMRVGSLLRIIYLSLFEEQSDECSFDFETSFSDFATGPGWSIASLRRVHCVG